MLKDSQAHTSAERNTAAPDMMTTCNQPQDLLHLKRWAHTAGHWQVLLQVLNLSSVQVRG